MTSYNLGAHCEIGHTGSESESDVRIPMPTPPQHRLDQAGRDARGRIPFVRPPSTPFHSIDRPNTHPMTPIHLMDRPNPPPERQPKRRRTWTPPTRHRTWPTGSHPPTMQIFAKTLTGKTITIDVEDTDNSTIIKRKIEFKTKVPIDKFHLLLRGKPWGDDNSTVSDYDIQKDDTVRMVAGLFAGMFGNMLNKVLGQTNTKECRF